MLLTKVYANICDFQAFPFYIFVHCFLFIFYCENSAVWGSNIEYLTTFFDHINTFENTDFICSKYQILSKSLLRLKTYFSQIPIHHNLITVASTF
jgi:hypothetical protein